jgi:protein-tyrosine phosphatase
MSLPARPKGEYRSAQHEGTSVSKAFRVVFVCTGNICRSPTAHGVFRQRVLDAGLKTEVHVDSAGTHGYHVGDAPDARSQAHARSRGYELADLRARQLAAADFAQADLLLVMDEDNLRAAQARCPAEHRHKLRRFTEFCRVHRSRDVPDPYYGGAAGFELVLDLVEDGCDGLLAHARAEGVTRRA